MEMTLAQFMKEYEFETEFRADVIFAEAESRQVSDGEPDVEERVRYDADAAGTMIAEFRRRRGTVRGDRWIGERRAAGVRRIVVTAVAG